MMNQYPYTDAHELNLDWILKKVKELIAEWESVQRDWNEVKQDWADTKEAWQELRDFVTNYFDNLDVQEEINNKIDAMVDSGEFAQLIAPFVTDQLPEVVANQIAAVVADQISAVVAGQIGDVVAAQIDGVVAEQIDGSVSEQIGGVVADQIGGAVSGQIDDVVEDQIGDVVATQLPPLVTQETATQVTSWLNQHVDPSTGYVIDDTLTIQGAAADAKAVGDRFNSGYYPGITVGLADNLNSATYEEDSVPYLFRTTGGSLDVGNREYDEIVGGTVAWNQLVPAITSGEIYNNNGITCRSNGDGSFTLNGTTTTTSLFVLVNEFMTPIDHIFYVCGYVKDNANTASALSFRGIKVDYGNGSIWKNTSTYSSMNIRLDYIINANYSNTIIKPQVFDLTQMFGVTIANYLYTLESGTPGAGIAKLKSWGFCTKPYYLYDAGELLNVHPSKHVMTGFQQWDEEWEVGKIDWDGTNATDSTKIRCKNFIQVVPNTTYYVTAPYGIEIFYYDGSRNLISFEPFSKFNTDFTTPINCHYMKFFVYYPEYGTTYNHDICINISWDGERNGQYEEYRKYEYELDYMAGSSAEVSIGWRGIPKLDANNELYYDGDVYKHDGSNVRSYAYTDLGSLTWEKVNDHFVSQAVNIAAPESDDVIGELINAQYVTMSANAVSQDNADKTIAVNTSRQILVYDSTYASATAADFKTAMDGNVIVLKLSFSVPGADVYPFDYPQICDDWGTEWYVDGYSGTPRDAAVPVGHNTKYMANLKAKLEMGADSPSANGDYLLRHSNGLNAFVPYVKELPAAPSGDGTYKLQCTVTGGSASMSWVLET